MSRKNSKLLLLGLLSLAMLGCFLVRYQTVDATNGQEEIQIAFLKKLEQVVNVKSGSVRRTYSTEGQLPVTYAASYEWDLEWSLSSSIVDSDREYFYYLLVDEDSPTEVIAGNRRYRFDENSSIWYYQDDAFFPNQYIAPELLAKEQKELLSERDPSLFAKGKYGLEFHPKTYSDFQLIDDVILESYIFNHYPFATNETPIQDYMEQIVGLSVMPIFYVRNNVVGLVLEDESGDIVYTKELKVEVVESYEHSRIPENAITYEEWLSMEEVE
ncbi:TPA: hypothetical protein ACGOY6_001036 [Streptococcus suis]